MERAELFLFSSEIVKFSETEEREITATYENMEQIGIANMPYPLTDIGMNGYLHDLKSGEPGYFIDNNPKDAIAVVEVRFRYDSSSKSDDIMVKLNENWHDVHALVSVKSPEHLKRHCSVYHEQAARFRRTLMVLLATRGVIKTRTKDKLLAMGLGRKRLRDNMRPLYTTTLTLPIARDVSHPHKGSLGVSKRPHLRRGHSRVQRHGPKYEFVKMVWVEPCFVNADENFVSARFSYNASRKDGYEAHQDQT